MQPKLENPSVDPESGLWDQTFDYSVNCNFSKRVDITLEVYNLSLHDWKTEGDKSYNKTGEWGKLTWENVKLCSGECEGTSSYRFKYNETILLTKSGPTITPPPITILKEFKNGTVKPASGHYNDSFDYSVYVNLNKTIDITLEVFDISKSSYEWKIAGKNQTYNKTWGWHKLTWNNVSNIFKGDCAGIAIYRFYYIDASDKRHESDLFYGPELISYNETKIIERYYYGGGGGGGGGSYRPWITYEKATVDPNWVLIGVRENKSFNYSVRVNRDVTLKLEIYNLSSKKWEDKEGKKGSRVKGEWGKWEYEWTINLTLDKNWKGICKYQFYPEDRDERYGSQIYYGPEIKSIEEMYVGWKKDIELSDKRLKEPIIRCIVTPSEDRWCKPFKYTATIEHPDKANMTLALFVYKPGSDKYKLVLYKPYKENVVIKNQPGYPFYNENSITVVEWIAEGIFDENDANKPPYKYYIWYYDGWNEAEIHSEKSKNILTEPKNVLINNNPSIKGITPPEDGSVRSTYIYKAEIEDPDKNDTIFVLLHVKDPLNRTRYLKPERIERKNEIWDCLFVVSPESGIFSRKEAVDAINKTENKSFTSEFQLEFQDECMKAAGKIKNTTWITGQNVSLVKVGLDSRPEVEPSEGKYTDKFKYTAWFYSSEDNILNVKLLIYNPSNSKIVYSNSTEVFIDAERNFTSWVVKPGVFGSEYFGKNVSYKIEWKDRFGNNGTTKNFDGPHIERAVPSLFVWLLLIGPIVGLLLILFQRPLVKVRGKLGWK